MYLVRIDLNGDARNILFQTLFHLQSPGLEGIALFAAESKKKKLARKNTYNGRN